MMELRHGPVEVTEILGEVLAVMRRGSTAIVHIAVMPQGRKGHSSNLTVQPSPQRHQSVNAYVGTASKRPRFCTAFLWVTEDGVMLKKMDPALRERAVRLVRAHRGEYPSTTAAAVTVARQLGVARESVRRWGAKTVIDDGGRPGTTSEESAEFKRPRAESRRLREDNEILKATTVFFASMSA